MITIRRTNNHDQQVWDDYVNQHAERSPYHLYGWQYAVSDAYQHKSYYLIAEQKSEQDNEACNKVVGVLPLVIFQKPLSKPSLCALPFCDVGGVLADNNEIKEQLIAESQSVAGNIQATFIELRSTVTAKDEPTEQSSAEVNSEKVGKVSMLMPLPESSELLFSGFKSKLRSQIRKAEKNGLHYQLGSEKNMLDDFYQVFSHNMRALGSPVHAKQWFESLLNHYQEKMVISLVYKGELPIGAGIVLITGNKAAIPWASTKAEYNRLSPNMMLYWSLLKHLSDNGVTQFDFGRSSYGEGTFKFKQQWGAQPTPLDWQVIDLKQYNNKNQNKQDNTPAASSNLRALVENVWRKFPINVTIFLGPKIRKYISL